jgi:hypothetical protein
LASPRIDYFYFDSPEATKNILTDFGGCLTASRSFDDDQKKPRALSAGELKDLHRSTAAAAAAFLSSPSGSFQS